MIGSMAGITATRPSDGQSFADKAEMPVVSKGITPNRTAPRGMSECGL